jgi:hypothetical protein
MKKIAITFMALGLVVGSLATPGLAGKKKAFKGPLDFYMHWDDDGAGGCEGAVYMDLEDKPGDTSCAFVFQGAQEVLIAGGQGALIYSFPATGGLPFKLNAKKGVTGLLAISHAGIVGGSVDFKLSGMTKKGSATLVEESLPIEPAPPGTAEIELDLALSKKLHGQVFESLGLDVTIRGVTPNAYVDMESPASYLRVYGR